MKYISIIITFFILLLDAEAKSFYDKNKNPIYHAITLLNSRLDKDLAFKYSNIIARFSKLYRIDPFLVVSISRQESHLNLGTVRKIEEDDIVYDEREKRFIKIVEITDFCMMQIHKSNVINKKLDVERLLTEPEYCIHEGFKVLRDFKYLKNKDPNWWTRYNAVDSYKREIYRLKVMKHYGKITNTIKNYQEVIERYSDEKKVAYNQDTL